jgi:hypothetical protein
MQDNMQKYTKDEIVKAMRELERLTLLMLALQEQREILGKEEIRLRNEIRIAREMVREMTQ